MLSDFAGKISPTSKQQIETLTDGGIRYSLDLNGESPSWPPFIRRLSSE
jgi:hypothetical protein